MKFKHLTLMIFAGLFAVSCSDDDSTPDYASRIAKTYTGSVELSISGTTDDDYMGLGKSLEISRYNNDSIVAVLTIDYGVGSSMGVEKVTAGAKVTHKDGVYMLTGGETVTSAGSYNITATLTGEISDENTDVTISFVPGSMPMAIVAKFSAESAVRTIRIDATNYAQWTYFSFSDGIVATYTMYQDPETKAANGTVVDDNGNVVNESSFDWDIAIHRYDIRTNGGSVVNTEKEDFNSVTTVPTTGFTADTEREIIVDMTNMMTGGIIYQKYLISQVLDEWNSGSLMSGTFKVHPYVFFVKTAEGKYAKLQFVDSHNDEGKSGYPKFTYEYPVE